jgi:hypothetical protein
MCTRLHFICLNFMTFKCVQVYSVELIVTCCSRRLYSQTSFLGQSYVPTEVRNDKVGKPTQVEATMTVFGPLESFGGKATSLVSGSSTTSATGDENVGAWNGKCHRHCTGINYIGATLDYINVFAIFSQLDCYPSTRPLALCAQKIGGF